MPLEGFQLLVENHVDIWPMESTSSGTRAQIPGPWSTIPWQWQPGQSGIHKLTFSPPCSDSTCPPLGHLLALVSESHQQLWPSASKNIVSSVQWQCGLQETRLTPCTLAHPNQLTILSPTRLESKGKTEQLIEQKYGREREGKNLPYNSL